MGKFPEPLGTPKWFFLSFWLDLMNIKGSTEPIFENFDFGAFLTRFGLNLARFSEFRLKFAPKMPATCLKIKIFKKGLCTALDISNTCH